jgi:hypothetical protein
MKGSIRYGYAFAPGPPGNSPAQMFDDGAHGDGAVGDLVLARRQMVSLLEPRCVTTSSAFWQCRQNAVLRRHERRHETYSFRVGTGDDSRIARDQ